MVINRSEYGIKRLHYKDTKAIKKEGRAPPLNKKDKKELITGQFLLFRLDFAFALDCLPSGCEKRGERKRKPF